MNLLSDVFLSGEMGKNSANEYNILQIIIKIPCHTFRYFSGSEPVQHFIFKGYQPVWKKSQRGKLTLFVGWY